MSAARREVYVYYRVAQPHWRAAASAVAHWQRRLCDAHPGLVARVLRRPDLRDDAVTLMETYAVEHNGGGIDAALEAEIAGAATVLRPWLIGERHVERFEVVDPAPEG